MVNRRGEKLHIGCGDQGLAGWVNIDMTPYPAVDTVQDVTRGLPFRDARFIFAEHFIEHLTIDEARRFLAHCRTALASEGVLRLTTPNLDWVWRTAYHPDQWSSDQQALDDCLGLNRSFYGWGHHFLYNRAMLQAVLLDAGFAEVEFGERGESDHPELRDLERHEVYPDTPELPHVLVVEARGSGGGGARLSLGGLADYRRDTEAPWHLMQYGFLSLVRLLKRLLGR